jgi:hypothetical protein
VVVGHQHLYTFSVRHIDARVGRDAVIHGQDQLGTARRRLLHHFGAQAVAVLKAIGHQIVDGTATHTAQRQHRQGGTGGTISVEIPHHHDATMIGQCLLQDPHGGINAVQLLPGQHAFDAALQLLLRLHAAQRV